MKYKAYYNLGLILLLSLASLTSSAAAKRPFKTSDFAGDWVMSTSSVGGVGVNPGPGIASSVMRCLTLDALGNGKDNNGSYTFYRADGSFVHYDDDGGPDNITLTLEDPIHGVGKLTYTDTNTYKTTQVYDFFATRSRNGAVNKLFLELVDSHGSKVVVNGVAERQQER